MTNTRDNDKGESMSYAPKTLQYPLFPPGYDPLFPWSSPRDFDRKEVALALKQYLGKNPQGSGVVAINAPWGAGKTLFLRMWQDSLLAEGRPCIYFNAWEYDFLQQPILAFLAGLESQKSRLPVLTGENSDEQKAEKRLCREQAIALYDQAADQIKKMAKTVQSHGEKIFRLAGPSLGAAAVAAWLESLGVDTTLSSGAGKAVNETITGYIEKAPPQKNEILSDISKSLEDMSLFRKELEEYAQKLTGGEYPLFIMVDELDRCRPDFAISLLEEIKHLFSVPGVYFILAVEKRQLANCIKARYGLTGRAECIYLDKFIDLTVELPKLSAKQALDFTNWHVQIQQIDFNDFAKSFIEKFCPELQFRGIAQAKSRLGFVCAQNNLSQFVYVAAAVIFLIQSGHTQQEAFDFLRKEGERIVQSLIDDTFQKEDRMFFLPYCWCFGDELEKKRPGFLEEQVKKRTDLHGANLTFDLTRQFEVTPEYMREQLEKTLGLAIRCIY